MTNYATTSCSAMKNIASTLPQKIAAYTTPRADVAALVPADAISIRDVGCSNGSLG